MANKSEILGAILDKPTVSLSGLDQYYYRFIPNGTVHYSKLLEVAIHHSADIKIIERMFIEGIHPSPSFTYNESKVPSDMPIECKDKYNAIYSSMKGIVTAIEFLKDNYQNWEIQLLLRNQLIGVCKEQAGRRLVEKYIQKLMDTLVQLAPNPKEPFLKNTQPTNNTHLEPLFLTLFQNAYQYIIKHKLEKHRDLDWGSRWRKEASIQTEDVIENNSKLLSSAVFWKKSVSQSTQTEALTSPLETASIGPSS